MWKFQIPGRRFRYLLDQETDKSPNRGIRPHVPAPGWHSIAPPRGPPGATPSPVGGARPTRTSGNPAAAGHLPGGASYGLPSQGPCLILQHSHSPIQQGSWASNAAYWGKPPRAPPNRSSQPEPLFTESPANLPSRSPPASHRAVKPSL